ncbi:unnamed protein product (plasmid) [Mycetohabitans rhizoxinica HKI 454]|uniref:Uncharacterized protein n=1 Tax=Mycetohabitans rhizoxinica (strain DSM 19002 / CIP 109453 / HKI 454) TaxID=882378 RepID=E5ATU5_MYCRK|nr:unnamed protein product [Mycetohabitans rhizoxinica HKI 454]
MLAGVSRDVEFVNVDFRHEAASLRLACDSELVAALAGHARVVVRSAIDVRVAPILAAVRFAGRLLPVPAVRNGGPVARGNSFAPTQQSAA